MTSLLNKGTRLVPAAFGRTGLAAHSSELAS